MSRLDDHVAAVQNRIALRLFILALAWASVVFASLLLIGVLLDRLFLLRLPRPDLWLYGAAAVAVIVAVVYAVVKRPGATEAAIPIDQKLGLKEKISTALFIRTSTDPFARAAVKDAEETARQVVVNLGQHFPLSFPRPAYASLAIALIALGSYQVIDPMNWFNRREKQQVAEQQEAAAKAAEQTVRRALSVIEGSPPSVSESEQIKLAKADLTAMLQKPIADPTKASRTAEQAMESLKAESDRIKESVKYAQAKNEQRMFQSMQKPIEGQGPVADSQRAIAEGKFSDAVDDLEKVAENFDKMDKEQQKKAAEQMQQMAQQLQQMANNPAQQAKLQQQLQQMGMNQQQAKQAQQLMQQAAQGNKQAQQQLQQMAQQAMKQMNNGQGATPQQQQIAQQMMNQMQAQANAQATAQQMAQAAQQMAQAMQQAAQGQQQQPGQQQGQQPGQQMAQAKGQMQQQLQNMQAAAQDAQQIAAAQAGAQAAQQAAQQAMGGGAQGGQQGNGGGQWNPNGNINGGGNQQGKFNGQGGFAGPNQGGPGAGDRTYKNQAPYAVKQEIDPSQDDEKGRILASNYIRDQQNNRGQSTAAIKEVAQRTLNEQTDEIDQDRISRQAQRAVREYFGSMTKDNNP